MGIFAEHCRIPLDEAERIAAEVKAELGPECEDGPACIGGWKRSDYARARAKWTAIMETMRPRWKREAAACIARHGLVIYGAEWRAA